MNDNQKQFLQSIIAQNIESFFNEDSVELQEMINRQVLNQINTITYKAIEDQIKSINVDKLLSNIIEQKANIISEGEYVWNAYERVIDDKITKILESKLSNTPLSTFIDSRSGPTDERVVKYIDQVVHKHLEKQFDEYLKDLISKYIVRLGVVDIKDMQNEIISLNHNISHAANEAYEAGQRDGSRF